MGKSYSIVVSIFFTLIIFLPPSVCYGGDREKYPDSEKTSAFLNWVQDGETTKEQVFEKLGDPDDCFLENKILTYSLYGPSEKEVSKYAGEHTTGWIAFPNVYSLQLVFESSNLMNTEHNNNFLIRHSLVKIRNQVSSFSFEDHYPEYNGPRKNSCID
jgi:hypothetical protein